MRVQARLDDEAQRQLEYLVEVTGQCVSQILREGVARYCREVRSARGGLRRFAKKLIGKGHYKRYVAEGIDAKHCSVRK